MGANCCIAAKEKPQPNLASVEVSTYRIRHSPSWSFRWDNRTHIEDIMETNTVFSSHSSGNVQPDLKSGSVAPAEGDHSGDDQVDAFRTVKWQKSEKKMEASKLSKVDPRDDQSTAENPPPKAQANSHKSLDVITTASEIKAPMYLPSTPILGSIEERADPSSSINHSSSTGQVCQTAGHQPYRQILDTDAPSLNNVIENSSAERRPSSSTLSLDSNNLFAALSHGELDTDAPSLNNVIENSSAERRPSSSTLSSDSNNLFAALSHGESSESDGLSTCTPSEPVTTSQRDRWSVDNEPGCSAARELSGSYAPHPRSSPDQGVCKLCSRLLTERSSWNGHELAVVAVLFCSHAYHANCLDSITAESEKYDPPCPVCTHGESRTRELFGKLDLKINKNKNSKNMSASDLSQSSKRLKKSPRLGISSSMKESFQKPFLRRHFSTGSRPPRSVLGSEPTRKKGFWSRRWRE